MSNLTMILVVEVLLLVVLVITNRKTVRKLKDENELVKVDALTMAVYLKNYTEILDGINQYVESLHKFNPSSVMRVPISEIEQKLRSLKTYTDFPSYLHEATLKNLDTPSTYDIFSTGASSLEGLRYCAGTYVYNLNRHLTDNYPDSSNKEYKSLLHNLSKLIPTEK